MNIDGTSTRWEVPEFAGAGVLVAVGLFILGATGSGIARSVYPNNGPTSTATVGRDLAESTSWAEPLLVLVVLAVLGICWWQVSAWSDTDDDDADATAHIARGLTLTRWTLAELFLIGTGAVLFFVGSVMSTSSPAAFPAAYKWSQDLEAGGGLLAVLTIVTVGLLVARTYMPRREDGEEGEDLANA